MQHTGKKFTPVLWLVLLLCVAELVVRLPYMLWAKSNSYIGYASRFQNFSIYSPNAVIFDGTMIVLMVLVASFVAQRLVMAQAPRRPQITPLAGLGWQTYAVAGFTLLAVVFCLLTLGIQTILENISAKRDLDEIDAGILLYIFLKASLFNHVLATLFYMLYLSTRKLAHLGLAVFFGAATALVSIVFSQRAMLFVLGFEIVYITYLFGELNVRKLLAYTLPIGLVLVSIGIFRSTASDGLPLGEAVLLGFDKLMMSRYFFHLGKLGCVFEWQSYSGLIDFLSFNFLVEPFAPEKTIYFKEVGPLVGREVFGYSSSGVTLGLVSEFLLSFGAVLGSLFVFISFVAIFNLERFVLARRQLPLLAFFALAKMPILFNTSLGSYFYQFLIESAMLLPIMMGVSWAKTAPVRAIAPRAQLATA